MSYQEENKIKDLLKLLLNILSKAFFYFFSIDMDTKKNEHWFKKNLGNIASTILVLCTCTILASLNSLKAQEKLILKKISIIENMLTKDHQILERKFKQNSELNLNYKQKIKQISLKKENLTGEMIFKTTKNWQEFLTFYLSNETVQKTHSSYIQNDIIRKKNKLNSAIFRYNKEATLLNKWLKKFPNNYLKKISNISEKKMFDIKDNTTQYTIYD